MRDDEGVRAGQLICRDSELAFEIISHSGGVKGAGYGSKRDGKHRALYADGAGAGFQVENSTIIDLVALFQRLEGSSLGRRCCELIAIIAQAQRHSGIGGFCGIARCAFLVLGVAHFMNRRRFLHSATVTALASTGVGRALALDAENPYRKNIGLQLYTLRKELAQDTPGTIKAVVAAGYKQGEMFGFPNCEPVIKAAKDSGLELHSSHFEWASVIAPKDEGMSDFMKILEAAHKAGLGHLVIPYLTDDTRKSLDDYKRIAANANKAAAKAKTAGIQLSYHNHAFEFAPHGGGKTGFDIFIAEFSPDMHFELDLFWVKVGGAEPLDMLKKLKGRVSQVHLKDLKAGLTLPNFGSVPPDAFKELGSGIIPTEPLIVAAKEAGVKHCHVEQDQSPDALASIRQSIAYLQKL